MFTAVAGGGAHLNGAAIHVSEKSDLRLALTGTGQPLPSEDAADSDLLASAYLVMLRNALTVRQAVPVGQHLTQVAAGRTDVHWQFENLRSHIAPLLVVTEAGGNVSDLDGRPWEITSRSFVAANPTLHPAALALLQSIIPSSMDDPIV